MCLFLFRFSSSTGDRSFASRLMPLPAAAARRPRKKRKKPPFQRQRINGRVSISNPHCIRNVKCGRLLLNLRGLFRYMEYQKLVESRYMNSNLYHDQLPPAPSQPTIIAGPFLRLRGVMVIYSNRSSCSEIGCKSQRSTRQNFNFLLNKIGERREERAVILFIQFSRDEREKL